MLLFTVSFLAGILTILAPCVLPVLPVILWGTLNESNYKRITTIICSFVLSIIIFTFLLKVSTVFITIDQQIWKSISGGILIIFWMISIYPAVREQCKSLFGIKQISWPKESKSLWWQILLWASLGPIFTTCSPTYTLIIATILPLSLITGTISIILYALGLWFAVGMVAVFGKTLIKKLNIISDGDGRFKKVLWIVIVITGIAIITGFDKKIETSIIDAGRFGITSLEQNLVNTLNTETSLINQQTGWSYIDYDANILSSLSGDIVLFFHADRCPTCQQAEKNFLASGIPIGLTILKVDYDQEAELKKKYAILTQTSFVYIENDGTLIKRWVGWLTIDDILSKVNQAKWQNWDQQSTRIPSNQIAKAYFAGGCFRCMEWPFESLEWVKEATNGYIGGSDSDAHYDIVSSGKTQHREAVEVTYDPALIHYDELLDTYRRQIDPTDAEGQFADRWYQYTTAIYYNSEDEKKQVLESKNQLEDSKKFAKPIAVEIVSASSFYPAETYHQDYYKKNANHYNNYKKWSGREDYIHNTRKDSPRTVSTVTQDSWSKTPAQIQQTIDNLSPEQKKILFEWGTEPAFNNAYRDNHDAWIYVDIIDGTPLFSSTDKFDSGTGRPSFSRPIEESFVWSHTDTSYGMSRTEIKSSSSQWHLGHVFDDGPQELGGTRYCINSAALEFIPVTQLEEKWYSEYKKLFIK